MQKETECPCTEIDCEQHCDCVACYRLEAVMQKLPFCMRMENTIFKGLEQRVNARLLAAGIPLDGGK